MIDKLIADSFEFSLPLFIMAVGGIYSECSGITNLALEGLQGMGAFAGAFATTYLMHIGYVNSQVCYYVAMIFAMLGGMIYAMLYAMLCIKFKADQVLSGVVINMLSVTFTTSMTKGITRAIYKESYDNLILGTYPFPWVIVVVGIFAWYVLYQTRYGFRLRACGDNPRAVEVTGVEVGSIRYIAVLVSGALSGLAGMSFAYSVFGNYSSEIYAGYGYLSIATMICGNWKIVPTFLMSLFLGVLRTGGEQWIQMGNLTGSAYVFIMALPYGLTLLLLVFCAKK